MTPESSKIDATLFSQRCGEFAKNFPCFQKKFWIWDHIVVLAPCDFPIGHVVSFNNTFSRSNFCTSWLLDNVRSLLYTGVTQP